MTWKKTIKNLAIFVILLGTIPSSAQLSGLQIQHKIEDSWVYKDRGGEIRYDIPKFRMQKLERKWRQASLLNTLYLDSKALVTQVTSANINLQSEIKRLNNTYFTLEIAQSSLQRDYDDLVKKYNKEVLKGKGAKYDIKDLELELKETKSQRNWALTAAISIAIVVILTK